MKKEKKLHEDEANGTKDSGSSVVVVSREDILRAIADGVGEYRRQIDAIRARHGKYSRRSLQPLS